MQFDAESFQELLYNMTYAPQPAFKGAGGTTIPESQTERDLGINICNNASLHVHVAQPTTK